MFVRDIMTPLVKGVPCDAPLSEAALIMREDDTGFVPVLQGTDLIGVVTDRDIVTRGVVSGRKTDEMPVSAVMTPCISTVRHDYDVSAAARRMKDEHVRRLMVVDEKGMLIGVVSLADLATGTDDDQQKGEVLEEVSHIS